MILNNQCFAFGVLGWKPDEYYNSTPFEFFCAVEGYFIKLEHEASLHRLASWRIHQSLVQKPLPIEHFWPLWGDKETQKEKIAPLSEEEYYNILKRHNINPN